MSTLYCPRCMVWNPERARRLSGKNGVYRCPNCGETYTPEALRDAYARLERRAQAEANKYAIFKRRVAA